MGLPPRSEDLSVYATAVYQATMQRGWSLNETGT